MHSTFNHYLFSALILSVSSQLSASSENSIVPEIDYSNNIPEIERLKIDSDPTLMTKFTTEWEVEQDPLDAYENGHALLFHDGYIYTYLDRYKNTPILRRYNAINPSDNIVEKELPFLDLGILNAGTLPRHTAAIDNNGKFIFVFGIQNSNQCEIFIAAYDFDSNSVTASQRITLSEKSNMNATNLSFAKVKMNGSVDGVFELTTYITVSVTNNTYDIRPLTISGKDGAFSADLGSYIYRNNTTDATIVDICELDENHIVVSDIDEENPIMLLTYRSGDFDFTENWTDEALLPQLSTKSEPNSFGLHTVKHNGHIFLVYAHSYIGHVIYNVVKWEDFSSFEKMEHIARINVGSSANLTQIYEGGLRQIIVEGEQRPTPSRDNNFYNESSFYTYAPGVKLARHKIITETDLIYTAISSTQNAHTIRLDGHILSNPKGETVRIFDAAGKTINISEATVIDLESLSSGFYLIESRNSVVKVIL